MSDDGDDDKRNPLVDAVYETMIRAKPPLDPATGEVRGKGRYMAWIGDDAVAEVEGDETHCYREPMELRDGVVVETFLCGRFGPPCACGAVSEFLCDFPIGEEERACDKPCCERCAPTIGVDKNFCPEHRAAGAGENMLLFKRKPSHAEVVALAKETFEKDPPLLPKRPRLRRAPKPHARWRVVKDIGAGDRIDDMMALTGWMTEVEAGIHCKRLGFAHFVQTWDEYVALFRKKYPPPARKPRPRKPKG
jgi:hypothetical protein